MISPAVINGETFHKAEFATVNVQKSDTYMPLSARFFVVDWKMFRESRRLGDTVVPPRRHLDEGFPTGLLGASLPVRAR